jgi:hypothetical protein
VSTPAEDLAARAEATYEGVMAAHQQAGVGRRKRCKAAIAVIRAALEEQERAKSPVIETVADLLKYRFTLRRPGDVIGWGQDRAWKGRTKRVLRRWICKIQYVDKPSGFHATVTNPEAEPKYWPGIRGLLVYLTNGHRVTCAFIPDGEFGGRKDEA